MHSPSKHIQSDRNFLSFYFQFIIFITTLLLLLEDIHIWTTYLCWCGLASTVISGFWFWEIFFSYWGMAADSYEASVTIITIITIIIIQRRTQSCSHSIPSSTITSISISGDSDRTARSNKPIHIHMIILIYFTFPLDNHRILIIIFTNFIILYYFNLIRTRITFATIRYEILFI